MSGDTAHLVDCPGKGALPPIGGSGLINGLALTHCAVVGSDTRWNLWSATAQTWAPRVLHDLSAIRHPLGRIVAYASFCQPYQREASKERDRRFTPIEALHADDLRVC